MKPLQLAEPPDAGRNDTSELHVGQISDEGCLLLGQAGADEEAGERRRSP